MQVDFSRAPSRYRTEETRSRYLSKMSFGAGTLVQLALSVIGILFFLSVSTESSVILLLAWCSIGSAYLVAIAVTLSVTSRATQNDPLPISPSEVGPVARIVSGAGTLLASVVGAGAALQVGFEKTDPLYGAATTFVGIWAMLLAWCLLQWGLAQTYFQLYYRSAASPLAFPETPHPRLVDFVYFSVTLGTTFAASDVNVQTSGMRWRVTAHSVLSFFFNGLIIVFAFSTIFNAGL